MECPTHETISNWDDASLFASAGYHAATRFHKSGFESLNETERIIYCLSMLLNEVYNGGFGQWLYHAEPQVICSTASACQKVGAESASQLVNDVLRPLQNPLNTDDWFEYVQSMTDEEHQRIEEYSRLFASVEQELHRCAYRYIRERWANLRTS